MICCDKCEEWFHGKCVGITRQIGRAMEERQSQWHCPECEKKQQPSIKVRIFLLLVFCFDFKIKHFFCSKYHQLNKIGKY